MENKLFWTLRPDGREILRDLKKENENLKLSSFEIEIKMETKKTE